MTDMLTRCPQCKTSFRITSAQLKTARGAVRCGSCLSIFKADKNLINNDISSTQQELSEVAANPNMSLTTEPKVKINALSPSQLNADEQLTSEELLEDTATLSSVIDSIMDVGTLSSSDVASSPLFGHKPKGIKDDLLDHADESWAVDLLEESEADVTPEQQTYQAIKKQPSKHSLTNDTLAQDSQYSAHTTNTVADEHTGSFTLVADDNRDTGNLDDLPLHEESDSDPLAQLKAIERQANATETIAPQPLHAFDPERAALLQNIESDPVVMAFQIEVRTWPKKVLWAGLSLLAILALYIQWNIYNFDDLARQQPYRSWYSTLCPLVSCQLPPLAAPEKIISYNLVVRSHPSIDQALIVDTIILNRAPFEQPFPKLELTFSDREHLPIASRQFTPADYLRGELAGRKQMPSERPIHIVLELTDPGPHAVNYSATIAP